MPFMDTGVPVDVVICGQGANATEVRELILVVDACRSKGIAVRFIDSLDAEAIEAPRNPLSALLLRMMPCIIDLRRESEFSARFAELPRESTASAYGNTQDSERMSFRNGVNMRPAPRFLFRSRGGKM